MKSIGDLDEKLVAALSYLFGPISGIVVLVMEKNNKFVRFHALQSTLWFLMLMVLSWILSALASIPVLGTILGIIIWPINGLLGLLSLASMIILMVKAYSGATTKIPIIGDVVWNQVNK